MESKRGIFWYKVMALVLVLALIVPVLAACGDDDEGETTTPAATTPAATTPKPTTPAATTPAATTPKPTTPAATTPAATLPFVDKPVKIGVICDWSGPGASAGWLDDGVLPFAKWYFNEKQGGIQVGDVRRPVEFVKFDMKGTVAECAAGARKLIAEGVVAITQGGWTNAHGFPIADVTDPLKVAYLAHFTDPKLFSDYKWTVSAYYNQNARNKQIAKLIVEKLKAKTVGILCYDFESDRQLIANFKASLKALAPDVKIVYEQYYPAGTTDFSSYLTRIKYEKPDVLATLCNQTVYQTIDKQIMEIGGWGNTVHVAMVEASHYPNYETLAGTQGVYSPYMSLPGYGTPVSKGISAAWAEYCEKDSAWCKKYSTTGSVPLPSHLIMFESIFVAVKAMEMAGTDDRAKVAEFCRSGKLVLDSPLGYLRVGTDGENDSSGFYTKVQDNKIVPIEL